MHEPEKSLIKKLQDSRIIGSEEVFEFCNNAIIWKNSCPACGKDMRFNIEESLYDKCGVEFAAWCFDNECSGHIDNNGMIC